MREKSLVFVGIVVLIALLIGLNAASFVRPDREPDTELSPRRSTLNGGATGTRAFYELLKESGREVVRWQEPATALNTSRGLNVNTFIVIGELRREMDGENAASIMNWVGAGGNLVLIDREIPRTLLPTLQGWEIALQKSRQVDIDPSQTAQMTANVNAAKPLQPTDLVRDVTAVQPSVYASQINLYRNGKFDLNAKPPPTPIPKGMSQPAIEDSESEENITADEEETIFADEEESATDAPVIHLANDKKAILADYRYGSGRVIILSDPFIVSNAGLQIVDNVRLALNLTEVADGIVAFDEFHQGYGSRGNSLYTYFAKTPLPAMFAQAVVIALFVLWTRGRRFARPLPVEALNRRTKLEYVSAMAELQKRTRSYDLAIENIYSRVRRNLARVVGMDNLTTTRKQLAEKVAERTGEDAQKVYNIFRHSEDVIQGEKVNAKSALELAVELRRLEAESGIRRTANFGKSAKLN